jgi:hypothetical protein
VAGSCENGNELSGLIKKGAEFIGKLSDSLTSRGLCYNKFVRSYTN